MDENGQTPEQQEAEEQERQERERQVREEERMRQEAMEHGAELLKDDQTQEWTGNAEMTANWGEYSEDGQWSGAEGSQVDPSMIIQSGQFQIDPTTGQPVSTGQGFVDPNDVNVAQQGFRPPNADSQMNPPNGALSNSQDVYSDQANQQSYINQQQQQQQQQQYQQQQQFAPPQMQQPTGPDMTQTMPPSVQQLFAQVPHTQDGGNQEKRKKLEKEVAEKREIAAAMAQQQEAEMWKQFLVFKQMQQSQQTQQQMPAGGVAQSHQQGGGFPATDGNSLSGTSKPLWQQGFAPFSGNVFGGSGANTTQSGIPGSSSGIHSKAGPSKSNTATRGGRNAGGRGGRLKDGAGAAAAAPSTGAGSMGNMAGGLNTDTGGGAQQSPAYAGLAQTLPGHYGSSLFSLPQPTAQYPYMQNIQPQMQQQQQQQQQLPSQSAPPRGGQSQNQNFQFKAAAASVRMSNAAGTGRMLPGGKVLSEPSDIEGMVLTQEVINTLCQVFIGRLVEFTSAAEAASGKPLIIQPGCGDLALWLAVKCCVAGPVGVTTVTDHLLPDGTYATNVSISAMIATKKAKPKQDGSPDYNISANSWKSFCFEIATALMNTTSRDLIIARSGWAKREGNGYLWPLNKDD